jgi:hypothetical protein
MPRIGELSFENAKESQTRYHPKKKKSHLPFSSSPFMLSMPFGYCHPAQPREFEASKQKLFTCYS